MALFSSSSSSEEEVTTNNNKQKTNNNNKTSKKKKTIRKVLILPIPSEIVDNPVDIYSVLPYLCQPNETIITYWTLPRTNKRKVCVLIEGSSSSSGRRG
ncbi:hypothetical protein ACHAWC_007826 [Mediolabrus comicus]